MAEKRIFKIAKRCLVVLSLIVILISTLQDPGQEYFLVSLGSTNEDKSPVYAILAKKKLQAS